MKTKKLTVTGKPHYASNNVIPLEDDILKINIHLAKTINLLVAALAEFKKYPEPSNVIFTKTEQHIENAILETTGELGDSFISRMRKRYNLD